METARSRQNNTRYSSVKYQLPILSLGRAFFISSNVDTLHFVRGSQEMNYGCLPNRSWTQSLKITLIMSGMHFVKFSTYVDAFWLVVMFIRWSGTLLKSNPSWHWLYRYSLTTCTPLLLLFGRALHGSSVPLFLVLHSSLKASAHSLGKKERDVDTPNECASPWPWKQTSTMLPSTKTLSNSMFFVPNFIHWFGARTTSQINSWSNQLVVAGQLATIDLPCTLSHLSGWGSRPDSSILTVWLHWSVGQYIRQDKM